MMKLRAMVMGALVALAGFGPAAAQEGASLVLNPRSGATWCDAGMRPAMIVSRFLTVRACVSERAPGRYEVVVGYEQFTRAVPQCIAFAGAHSPYRNWANMQRAAMAQCEAQANALLRSFGRLRVVAD